METLLQRQWRRHRATYTRKIMSRRLLSSGQHNPRGSSMICVNTRVRLQLSRTGVQLYTVLDQRAALSF